LSFGVWSVDVYQDEILEFGGYDAAFIQGF
jgi:hypothetical protein